MSQLLTSTEATDATATLYDRHHDRIRGYCLGQLRHCEEADDAAQSTFLYAFAALQRGVAPRNELPWLYTIAHNVCRTRTRSLRRRSRLESAIDLDSLCDTVGRDDPSRDDLDGLGSSLAALPENQRRALLLREWQGLSYAEIAARMGVTESAVEAMLFRARRSLAQKLRATERVASLATVGTFVVRGLRRLGSLTGTAKAAAATIAVGLAAGTVVQPLVHDHRHPAPKPGQNTQVQRAAPGVAMGISRGTDQARPAAHPAKPVVAAAGYAARQSTATGGAVPDEARTSPARQPTTTPETADPGTPPAKPTTVADPQPAAETPGPPAPSEPPTADPVRHTFDNTQTAHPSPSDAKGLLPAQVQNVAPKPAGENPPLVGGVQTPSLPAPVPNVLPDAPLPTPSVPAVPEAPSVPAAPLPPIPSGPTAPDVPSLPPPPSTALPDAPLPAAPSVPLPDSPAPGTPSTPLQASP